MVNLDNLDLNYGDSNADFGSFHVFYIMCKPWHVIFCGKILFLLIATFNRKYFCKTTATKCKGFTSLP